ncbi:f-box only protein 30 [Trichonephila inaurata madagascariensis]|uniref:F-box only protein 30 n=1 Tax=Trichonephila inaurata madagascariensis TaxID=2747483 RepID=A0A8X6JB45_9ARAC|nr:f-box only protein 30 [Trichonephila inaurata madagascariensis]
MDALEEGLHKHCIHCIKVLKCTTVPIPGKSCEIINCLLECGARFHACKSEEHKLLCMKEKVPCINAEYGCPAIVFRKNRGKHLTSCPASVIHCPEEWDRWPIHLHDKKTIQASKNLDPNLKSNLDVSLALRDQRMLRRWCVAAAQGQPLSNHKFKISPSSSLWVFRKWQNSRELSYPPGLEESVVKELCKTCKETTHNTSDSLSHCISNGNANKLHDSEFLDSSETSNKKDTGDCNNKMVNPMESVGKQKTENNNKLSNYEKSTQEHNELPYYNLDDVLQLSQFGTIVYHHLLGEGSLYIALDPAESYPPYLYNGHHSVACQILDLKFRNPSSTPPWCVSLGLDLNVEARSQHPPSNFMYTFLCCQEVRRDEYGWHYKNVHSEIHRGLNGWLLERCPLAQYGCRFARKKFNPLPKNSYITYNEAMESFGLAFSSPEEVDSSITNSNSSKSSRHEDSQSLNLVDLPFDVLQHIVRYLDSFSLANLSLSCHLLRHVCATVLKDRGLVHFKWERYKTKDNKLAWKASKRWFFSSHFTPIHTWTIEDKNNMANHMRICPYFKRIHQAKAFRYGDPKNVDPPQDKRFSDPQKEICEQNMTKL